MKLLFENWRKYLNETIEPALNKNEIEYIISDKFSFNSAQSSQHRWGYHQPIIDYYFDERIGAWKYKAAIPDGTDKVDKWPRIPEDGTWSDENIEVFLTRVKETPHQLNLFENWRRYLNEGVDPRIQKQVDNLLQLPDIGIRLKHISSQGPSAGVHFEYAQVSTQAVRPGGDLLPGAEPPFGTVSIVKTDPQHDGKCLDGYIIYSAEASRGWGPLLYETALEWASQNGGGLMPDRGMVSEYAAAVWEKYALRSDVGKKQLDVDHELANGWMKPYPQLTPDVEADDCDQGSSIQAAGTDWMDNSLSKIYYKEVPEVMNILKDAGRLIE